jgi:N-acetyltransferase
VARLEPLSATHVDALAQAAAEDRSNYSLAAVPDGRAATERYVLQLLDARAAGEAVPFAQVRVADGAVVGATRYLNFRRRPDGALYAVEVGGTWLAAAAQRSGINTEAKLLLMTQAFEGWGVSRLDIKTDARNDKARRAISALGASFEGVLRQWQPSQARGEEDRLRDTAMYSVLKGEWPVVKARLEERLTLY